MSASTSIAVRRAPALLLALLGCAGAEGDPAVENAPDQPYVLVLGSAQDAGLPQLGCNEAQCRRARADDRLRRFVSSILLADPRDGSRWLFDATPDLREQLELARHHPRNRAHEGPRPPLFDGIFLTHAHMGHYAGLLQLGPEAYAAHQVPTFVSARMRRFLETSQPWKLLIEGAHLSLRTVEPSRPVALRRDLTVEALAVPHRDEISDTLAFIVRGPHRSLLYLPDVDKWAKMQPSIESLIASVDVALIDGTFFADGEIPGRSMADIPHPFIEESVSRFRALPASERGKMVFTHLNHTNPAADPESEAAASVQRAGMSIAGRGRLFPL